MKNEAKIPVANPRTGKVDFHITPASLDDVKTECQALRARQSEWSQLTSEHRANILLKLSATIAKHKDELIAALAADTGRYGLSILETDGVAASIKRWIKTVEAMIVPYEGRSSSLPFITYAVENRPYPLVGVISPWNFPLTLALIDAVPALLAGCAVIIKPSEVTPRFAEPLRQIISEIPQLDAVLTVVDGAGETGSALVDNVDVVCFTGSVATGRKVGEQAARNFVPAFLELGGKDPAIVLESADIDRASTAILRGSIINTGQGCQSIERVYVHENQFDDFLDLLVTKAKAVTLNTPDIHSGHLGPLIFARQAEIIQSQIDDAVAKGAVVHTGGKIVNAGGLWYPPTVLSNVSHNMTVMTEETFGPVLPVMPFKDNDQAVTLANDSVFGLSASVFAADADAAIAVGRRIEAGGISINDAALTALMYEAEKNSFKLSGLGASRMGAPGLLRFFRKQSFMTNTADIFTIQQFDETISKPE
ncbi:MAG: aldehyde dehydrogenase family protein [Robiginitomaculum sp.]|nr:aldehyde dehydrogenase family protein [Robiginitomaculum sp.]